MNKEVRKAVDEAGRVGLPITQNIGTSTHAWGHVNCHECGQRIAVYSTGKAAEHGAKLIRRFTRKHREHQQ
jgi:hypothetical protein